jgi:hypothetical protein
MNDVSWTHSFNRVGNAPHFAFRISHFAFQISNFKFQISNTKFQKEQSRPAGHAVKQDINTKRDNPHKCATGSSAKFRESAYNKDGKTFDERFCDVNATISGIAIRMPF